MSATALDSYQIREERLSERPCPWRESRPRQIDTGEPTPIPEFLRRALRRSAPVPIWSVPAATGRKRVLKRPLAVHIYRDGDFVFAANEELVIIGHGTSPDEAVADFVGHVLHFAEEYSQLPHDRVTGDAVRLKALFADLFEE